MTTPRVFVANDPGDMDLSKAEKFGTVIRCTTGRLNIYRPQEVCKAVVKVLDDHEFDPTTDYVLLAGGTLAVFFVGVWAFGDLEEVQLLMYDAKEKNYFPRTVRFLEEIENMPEEAAQ